MQLFGPLPEPANPAGQLQLYWPSVVSRQLVRTKQSLASRHSGMSSEGARERELLAVEG